jgi:hypothetical protein
MFKFPNFWGLLRRRLWKLGVTGKFFCYIQNSRIFGDCFEGDCGKQELLENFFCYVQIPEFLDRPSYMLQHSGRVHDHAANHEGRLERFYKQVSLTTENNQL